MADELWPELYEGFLLTPDDARELQAQLERAPEELTARTRLLVWHAQAALDSYEHAVEASAHALWLIAHAPHAQVLSTPFGIPPDEGACAHAGQLWRAHVEAQPKDALVLAHAARFFSQLDRPFAEGLWYRLQLVDKARWESMTLDYPVHASPSPEPPSQEELERALAEAEEPEDQRWVLAQLVQAAFESGDADRARTGAVALLAREAEAADGDSLHLGHTVLGHLALAAGEVDAAKRHLLASVAVAPTARLESFGPDMSLAARLLAHGERACVREALSRARALWKMGQARLWAWEEALRVGERPTFVGQIRLRGPA